MTARPPAVVGLDLSLTGTGIAQADGSTTTVRTRASAGDRRLLTIALAVRDAVSITDGVDLVVIEDLPKHAMAAGITGMVHGVARAVLLETGTPYVTVAPATLKAYATGKGSGDKTAMALAAFKRAGAEFADDNQCDAWWLRAAGLDRLGAPLFGLPAAQRDRLDRVAWPEVSR
ncbi:Holliday junction endonuclease [Streptomyces sp. DSM 44917]|uniref:Holliday junction endonuclease n=1 Tax=Streptomyces boetiae TaxID=3075541 RepID=A0ABU2L5K7_9ACTN|nr:Holliday junction endonuclease [Streptomyces sp. DSM 44917]MDT0306841.1 Holliday junction endonuclease [Streptomyces sp. DSM 44917]